MSEHDRDILDQLVATNPAFANALQLMQFAMKLENGRRGDASAALVTALVIMASDAPDPKIFIELTVEALRAAPLTGGEAS
jgi:hypothetical protein